MAGGMLTRPPYAVTPGASAERNLIVDTWRRSLQDAPAYAKVPTRGYVFWVTDLIRHFLGTGRELSLRSSDRLYVARDVERPTYVYGWLLCRDQRPGLALVYVYVKGPHRREGIAKELLASALEATEDGPLTYAFRTRFDRWFDDLGMTFAPVEELQFGKRVAS